jgi:hypothetical protein
MYIHVHVVMYLYVYGIYMSVPYSDTYVQFCPILSRWVGFQMYTTHILSESESFGNMPWIYLDYSSACESASRSNAIGIPLLSQYTYFGCQGCLIFSAKRGRHAWQCQSVRCSPMWRSIDCDVAAAANPRKISWSQWCTHMTCTMHRQ